ncbi:MAG: penicillin-binding transpeptidase domain-containing protein, partial [Longicatena sp.]|nr:penicillin-binding transpeptidase domain-containing protein [Longicatena sp.]
EISMINAIALSDNIYAMKTSLAIGSDVLVKQLQRFDFSDIDNHPSLPLGTVDLSLFELSNIYLTLASEGLKVEPRLIVRVQNEQEVLYEHKQSLTQHFSRDETLMMNQMLRSVFDIKNQSHTLPSMIGYEPQFTMGVKSGTSDFDSLVMGIHPYYVIGVWVGFDDHRPLDKNYYPLSKQLFKTTMDTLYDDDLDTWYVPSQTLEVKKVNPISAKPQQDGSEYWFKK